MPKGTASEKTQAEEAWKKKEDQLWFALGSYERNKARAVQSLVAFKTAPKAERPKHLKDAADSVSLAQLARSVAMRHGRILPALPEIPAPRRQP